MDVMRTVAEMVIATLAAIGFYTLIHLLEECLLTPTPLSVAVQVRTVQELANLDLLLSEAMRHSVRTRGHPPVVLIDHRLLAEDSGQDSGEPDSNMQNGVTLDGMTQEIIDRYRAVWYAV